jgi:hypothetical protein
VKGNIMSQPIKSSGSDNLFIELSEAEQEVVTGGNGMPDLFIQRTDIATFGSNDTNISDGNRNYSSKSRTGYTMSQLTIGISGLFGGGGSRARRRRSSWGGEDVLQMLLSLFSYFS